MWTFNSLMSTDQHEALDLFTTEDAHLVCPNKTFTVAVGTQITVTMDVTDSDDEQPCVELRIDECIDENDGNAPLLSKTKLYDSVEQGQIRGRFCSTIPDSDEKSSAHDTCQTVDACIRMDHSDFECVQNVSKDFNNIFLCPMCGGEFNNPRLLPCLHTVCFKCIDDEVRRLKGTSGYKNMIWCHICKKEIHHGNIFLLRELPVNFTMIKRIDNRTHTAENEEDDNVTSEESAIKAPPTLYIESQCREEPSNETLLASLRHQLDFSLQESKEAQEEVSNLASVLCRLEIQNKERTDLVKKKINAHFDKFMNAVEIHRNRLLQTTQDIFTRRNREIDSLKEAVGRTQKKLQEDCSLVSTMLEIGQTSDLLSVFELTSNALEFSVSEVDKLRKSCSVRTSVSFCPTSPSSVIDGYQMYGEVCDSVVDPYKCYIQDQALHTAETTRPHSVILHVRDDVGAPYLHEVDVSAVVNSRYNPTERIPVTVSKHEDGRYRLTFTPLRACLHRLSVRVNGRKITDSPFTFPVVRPRGSYRKPLSTYSTLDSDCWSVSELSDCLANCTLSVDRRHFMKPKHNTSIRYVNL